MKVSRFVPAMALVGLGAAAAACDASDNPATPSSSPHLDSVDVTVDYVIDGDTIDGLIDGDEQQRIRLLAIDTPEVRTEDGTPECLGLEATERLRQLLPVGATVRGEYDEGRFDRFGRTLLYLFDGKTMVNEVLVEEGLAEAIYVRPNDAYLERLETAEERATAAGVGLHSDDLDCRT